MENTKEQCNIIKKYIKRALDQGQTYSYEVTLIDAKGRTELVARTTGLESFDADMQESIDSAKQMRGELEVKVFAGKSNNASVKNTYSINVSTPQSKEQEPDMRQLIREELQNIAPPQAQTQSIEGLGSLDTLVSAMTGQSDSKDGLAGLMGLATTLANQNSNVVITQTKHDLALFKEQAKYTTLSDKYNDLLVDNKTVKETLKETQSLSKEQKESIKQLEEQLAAYAPNELMRRMATGVVSRIGSNLLGNKKVANAIGVTEEELKGALGLIDAPEEEKPTAIVEAEPVQISAIEEVNLSPEEKQKKEFIDTITEALNVSGYGVVKQVFHILNVSLTDNVTLNAVEEAVVKIEEFKQKKSVEGVVNVEAKTEDEAEIEE